MKTHNVALLGGLVFDLSTKWYYRALELVTKSFLEGRLAGVASCIELVMNTAQKAIAFHSLLPPIFGKS